MSAWQDTLGSLDDRAKGGKTASALIAAAQETIDDLREVRDKMAKHGRDREAELEAAQKQLRELKEPKLSRSVEGEVVEFRFRPHGGRGRFSADNTWRLDEMESALTHLRLCGAQDSTEVTAYGDGRLESRTTADEAHDALGWSFKAPDHVIIETYAKTDARVVKQPRRGIGLHAFYLTATTSFTGGMALAAVFDFLGPLF